MPAEATETRAAAMRPLRAGKPLGGQVDQLSRRDLARGAGSDLRAILARASVQVLNALVLPTGRCPGRAAPPTRTT